MLVQSYRIGRDLKLDPIPLEDTEKLLTERGTGVWLDVRGNCQDAIACYLSDADLSEVLLNLCNGPDKEIARVIPAGEAVYFGLPVCTGAPDGTIAYLDALCLPGLLVTLHAEPIIGLRDVANALQRTSLPVAPSTSALVCLILTHFSTISVQQAQQVRRRVRQLTDKMDCDPEAVELEQLLAEKAAMRRLEAVDEESGPVFSALKVADTPALDLTGLGSYYDVALGNTAFLTRIVDRLGASLDDLHQRYVVNVQEKTNKRLAFLTVVSAIFLPLTLLAGIYGMNFTMMPELQIPYAYPALLALMVLLAVGMWRYFKQKGWFE